MNRHGEFAQQHHSASVLYRAPGHEPLRIRAVLFDAVGTVIRPEPSVARAYAVAGRRSGADLDEAEVSHRFRNALVRQDALDRTVHAGRTGPEREVERWQGIVADVFGPHPQAERIFDHLWEHFADPRYWRLFDDAPAVWEDLARCGLTLGLASNFDERLAPICAVLEPLAQCRHIFVSSQLGWRKPYAGFFRAIEAALQIPPAELLLVGDDLENDYRAARAAGWQAVLIERGDKSSAVQTGVDAIRSLAELAARFKPASRAS